VCERFYPEVIYFPKIGNCVSRFIGVRILIEREVTQIFCACLSGVVFWLRDHGAFGYLSLILVLPRRSGMQDRAIDFEPSFGGITGCLKVIQHDFQTC